MTNNPVIYEVFKKQYLRSIMDISANPVYNHVSYHFFNDRISSYGQYIIMLTTMFATLFKVCALSFFNLLQKIKIMFCYSSSLCTIAWNWTRYHRYFFQVLLLFFMFVMAFSSTFYLLLDEETVSFRCLFNTGGDEYVLVIVCSVSDSDSAPWSTPNPVTDPCIIRSRIPHFHIPWWPYLWWHSVNSTTLTYSCRGTNWNMLRWRTFCLLCLCWECQSFLWTCW